MTDGKTSKLQGPGQDPRTPDTESRHGKGSTAPRSEAGEGRAEQWRDGAREHDMNTYLSAPQRLAGECAKSDWQAGKLAQPPRLQLARMRRWSGLLQPAMHNARCEAGRRFNSGRDKKGPKRVDRRRE